MFGLARSAVGVQVEPSELCKHVMELGQCQWAAGLFHRLLGQKTSKETSHLQEQACQECYVTITRWTVRFLHGRGSQPVLGKFPGLLKAVWFGQPCPVREGEQTEVGVLAPHCMKERSGAVALIIPFQKHGLSYCRWEDAEDPGTADVARGWMGLYRYFPQALVILL